MQVKDVAALAETTVRAVRHYHAIGLLPIPPTRGRYRDYDVSHVARVSRIRWLQGSGLTLAQVAAVLADEPPSPGPGQASPHPEVAGRQRALDELTASLTLVEQQLSDLTGQRDRLRTLVAALERGDSLSPLPPVVAAYYARLEAAAPDERVRLAVRGEREFLELAVLRGEVPAEVELLFSVGPAEQQATLDAFVTALGADLTDEEVEELAEANVARIATRLGDRGPRVAAAVDAETVDRLYALFDATSDPRDRRIGAAMRRRMLAWVESAGEAAPEASDGKSHG